MLPSSRRNSKKIKAYSYQVRQPITPPLPFTRNHRLTGFRLRRFPHFFIEKYDYSHKDNGASYANPGDGRTVERLLFPLSWGPRSGGGLWRIVLLRRRRQVFPFHICGVETRELGVGEVKAFSFHVGDVCAGEVRPGQGSLVVGVEAHLERGIGSSVHARRGVWDVEAGEAGAVVGDTPPENIREVGDRFGICFTSCRFSTKERV